MNAVNAMGWVMTLGLLSVTTTTSVHGAAASPNVKRVTSGICYTRGQTGYEDARAYKGFESIEACLSAGGRLPNLKGFFNQGMQSPVPVAAPATEPVAPAAVAQSGDNKLLFDTDAVNIVKKARDGFCHDAASASFAETVHFAAYRTMQDCLQSGGRAVATQ